MYQYPGGLVAFAIVLLSILTAWAMNYTNPKIRVFGPEGKFLTSSSGSVLVQPQSHASHNLAGIHAPGRFWVYF